MRWAIADEADVLTGFASLLQLTCQAGGQCHCWQALRRPRVLKWRASRTPTPTTRRIIFIPVPSAVLVPGRPCRRKYLLTQPMPIHLAPSTDPPSPARARMAMLLRKVWGSVLARAAAPGADPRARRAQAHRAEQYQYHGSLSLGALDAVPTDVLAQILRLLGPLDAARSSAVCRAWRVLASDNGLWAFFLRLGPEPWDLVVFAETHLAAGPASHPWCVPFSPLATGLLSSAPALGVVPDVAGHFVGCTTIARRSSRSNRFTASERWSRVLSSWMVRD